MYCSTMAEPLLTILRIQSFPETRSCGGNYRLLAQPPAFKVMQDLLRNSTIRSTLDVYTQAITPAKQNAQAAVMSLVFPS